MSASAGGKLQRYRCTSPSSLLGSLPTLSLERGSHVSRTPTRSASRRHPLPRVLDPVDDSFDLYRLPRRQWRDRRPRGHRAARPDPAVRRHPPARPDLDRPPWQCHCRPVDGLQPHLRRRLPHLGAGLRPLRQEEDHGARAGDPHRLHRLLRPGAVAPSPRGPARDPGPERFRFRTRGPGLPVRGAGATKAGRGDRGDVDVVPRGGHLWPGAGLAGRAAPGVAVVLPSVRRAAGRGPGGRPRRRARRRLQPFGLVASGAVRIAGPARSQAGGSGAQPGARHAAHGVRRHVHGDRRPSGVAGHAAVDDHSHSPGGPAGHVPQSHRGPDRGQVVLGADGPTRLRSVGAGHAQ